MILLNTTYHRASVSCVHGGFSERRYVGTTTPRIIHPHTPPCKCSASRWETMGETLLFTHL